MNRNETSKWQTGGFIGIFCVIITMFLILPNFTRDFHTYVIFQACFFTLLLSLIFSFNERRLLTILEIACIVFFLIFDFLSFFLDSLLFQAVAYGFSAAFLVFIIFDLIKQILYSSLITTNLIFGALIVYVISGILWAKIYFIENFIYPGSFRALYGTIDFSQTIFLKAYDIQFNLIYYSFTVLTTLGMGDIIPVHNQAKALSVLEAMYGQLFVAIIIAKLVSVWRQTIQQQEAEVRSQKLE
jgi:voltage-gated potassium channel